jgi:hypothetical protein
LKPGKHGKVPLNLKGRFRRILERHSAQTALMQTWWIQEHERLKSESDHNVRALRQTALETPFQGISYETLPPPPEVHVPSAPTLEADLTGIDYDIGKKLKSFSRK